MPAGVLQRQSARPLEIQLVDTETATNRVSGGYASVIRNGSALRCLGELRSPAGSTFEFLDLYKPGPLENSFELAREVVIRNPAPSDKGFRSSFSLHSAVASPLRECEVFIPGIWYRHNVHVPPRALAGNLNDGAFLIREDRMPLPLVMMRDPHSGAALTLIHAQPDGSTSPADCQAGRVVDGRIQVASLGLFSPTNPVMAFCYPALEGERTYFRVRNRAGAAQAPRWLERFHPVQTGVKQSYKLLLMVREEPDFARAMRHAWRSAHATICPPVASADLAASYEASIRLLARWSQTRNGCPGIPFRLRLPQGELEGNEFVNYQMGFIGQQLPLAYHLLRYGLLNQQPALTEKGEAMVDFWATNALTAEGLPKTWFDVYPRPQWRHYNTYLRVACDGMAGALLAWDVMQSRGRALLLLSALSQHRGQTLPGHGTAGSPRDQAKHEPKRLARLRAGGTLPGGPPDRFTSRVGRERLASLAHLQHDRTDRAIAGSLWLDGCAAGRGRNARRSPREGPPLPRVARPVQRPTLDRGPARQAPPRSGARARTLGAAWVPDSFTASSPRSTTPCLKR